MYSIGEFSRINRITPKTLRHYDSIGLLKPAHIDDWTGYRYYSAAQLPLIQKILMLRDMGFSLPEIAEWLQQGRALESLLNQRAGTIKDSIRKEKERLGRVNHFLKILKGDFVMEKNIEIKELPEVIAASMRTIVPGYNSYFDVVPRMGDYMREVGAVCREPAYCFTIYHDGEYRESDIDVEICEAVEKPCRESEKVKFPIIPGFPEAACLKHKGPYDTIRESYAALFDWIEKNGFEVIDKPRECYIDGIWNKNDPSEWLTEVQIPVQKREQK